MTLVRIPISRNRHLPETHQRPSARIDSHRRGLTLFKISSIDCFSSGVIVTPAAPMFSSVRAVLLDPGIGMTCRGGKMSIIMLGTSEEGRHLGRHVHDVRQRQLGGSHTLLCGDLILYPAIISSTISITIQRETHNSIDDLQVQIEAFPLEPRLHPSHIPFLEILRRSIPPREETPSERSVDRRRVSAHVHRPWQGRTNTQ